MRNSPTEQGELSPSPGPMEADDRGDDDGLDIKPPQAGAGRANPRHKRKRRRKDRSYLFVDRNKDRLNRIGSGGYSRPPPPPLSHRDSKGQHSKSYEPQRAGSSREDYRKERDIRDARDRLDAVRGIRDSKNSSRGGGGADTSSSSWPRSYSDRRRYSSRERQSDDHRRHRDDSNSRRGRSAEREGSRRSDTGEREQRSAQYGDRSRSPISSRSARDAPTSSGSRNTKQLSSSSLRTATTTSAPSSRPSSQHTTPRDARYVTSRASGMPGSRDATPTQDEPEDRRAREDGEHAVSADDELPSSEDEASEPEAEVELAEEEHYRDEQEMDEDEHENAEEGEDNDAASRSDVSEDDAGSGSSAEEDNQNEVEYEEGSDKASYDDEQNSGGEGGARQRDDDAADVRLPFQPRSKFESDHSEQSSSGSDAESDGRGEAGRLGSYEHERQSGSDEQGEQDERSDDVAAVEEMSESDAEGSGSDEDDRDTDEADDAAYVDARAAASPVPLPPPSPPPEPAKPKLPPYYPAIQGCRNVDEFKCLNRIEEGTYGVVYRAEDLKKSEIVALKRLKMEKEKEGFPITSLREINTLLKAQHPNVVHVREIVVGSNMDKIYLVMDFVEHDLKSLMENMKQPFLIGEVKTLMQQLLAAVAHLHDNWILHRDLKTSNLLLSHKGILKVGDFGLAREYGSPLKPYTPIVVTLWYRAPELLLGCKYYSTPIDMWSVGCIFAELLNMKPLWPGKSENDQINKIFQDLGSPNESIWKGVMELPVMKKCTFATQPYNNLRARFGSVLSDKGYDLLNRFLTYDPSKRIGAEEAMKHGYFDESPKPVDPDMFPTWPAKSEQPRKRGSTPRPPSGGGAYKLLGDNDDEALAASGGFHMSGTAKGASAVGHGFSLRF